PTTVANLYRYRAGTTQLVSGAAGSATAAANASSGAFGNSVVVDPTGRFIAFASQATNLVAGQSGASDNVFLYDAQGPSLTLLSSAVLDANGVADVFTYRPGSSGTTLFSRSAFVVPKQDGYSCTTSTSADGRYTVFTSTATNLIPNRVGVNDRFNVFVYDNM